MCGNRQKHISEKRSCTFLCEKFKDELLIVFGVNISSDERGKHPPHLCSHCYRRIINSRRKRGGKEQSEFISSAEKAVIAAVDNNWTVWSHTITLSACFACRTFCDQKKGGRPKQYKSGKPEETTDQFSVSPQSPQTSFSDSFCSPTADVICSSPTKRLTEHPSCSTPVKQIKLASDIQTSPCFLPTPIKSLGETCVQTSPAKRSVQDATIKECLENSVTEPLNNAEQKLLTHLVKRALNNSADKVTVVCKTGGQPLILKKITKARKQSKDASSPLKKKRSRQLDKIRSDISGDSTSRHVQLSSELKKLPQQSKETVCANAGVQSNTKFNSEEGLHLKNTVGLTWCQLRWLKKTLSVRGVKFQSERKVREYRTAALRDYFTVDSLNLLVQDSQNKSNLAEKSIPVGRVEQLTTFVNDLLNDYDKKHLLTWHNGTIPQDEIWLKLGGDHGGGSFKLCLQVANLEHPNSKHNTFLVGIFEEKDSVENLHRVLGNNVIQNEISTLQSMVWRDKKVRLFLCGDYDFLCKLFGLSGARGFHPCLWCLATREKIQKGPKNCVESQPRTLSGLKRDFLSFQEHAGAKKSKVKAFNNVCSMPTWDISLSHVCPPYLHILLGVTQKHHHLLEYFCHEVDNNIAKDCAKNGVEVDKSTKFGVYVSQLQTLKQLEKKVKKKEMRLSTIDDNTPIALYKTTEEKHKKGLATLQKKIVKLKKKCKLPERTGPVASSLEAVLKRHNIHVEAYHSRSFVGNHANKYLKSETIKDLTDTVVSVCQTHTQNKRIIDFAKEISAIFYHLNTLYSRVHQQVGHDDPVSEEDIKTAKKSIRKYMFFFRQKFPDESVTPKQHMLEVHVPAWLSIWKFGMALHGEQGVEQTHAVVNALKPRVRHIKSEKKKIDTLMKEHYLVTAPNMKIKLQKKHLTGGKGGTRRKKKV